MTPEFRDYRRLSKAIVRTALKDFRQAARSHRRGKRRSESESTMREVAHFIRSDWFGVLTEADPDWVLEQLQAEFPEIDMGGIIDD
jgi:hypothetical protein